MSPLPNAIKLIAVWNVPSGVKPSMSSSLASHLVVRSSKQQRLHAVGVHQPVARRPGEDGEAAVLGRDQRHRVRLVLRELRRRSMAGATPPKGGHPGPCAAPAPRPYS